MIQKVISGGNTGADLAGLLAAERLGIPTGGMAPNGFRTEKGVQLILSSRFGLRATGGSYKQRTRLNVQQADGTVILSQNMRSPGTVQTRRFCQDLQKPYLAVDPFDVEALAVVVDFLRRSSFRVVNVAGNRESVARGITLKAANLLLRAFWISNGLR